MPKTLADIMTTDLVTLNEEDNLRQLLDGMDRFRVRHLPVVDGGRLVGLITHRDVLRFASSVLDRGAADSGREARLLEETFVHAVMRRDVRSAAPDTRILQAARIMMEGKLGCLPIVEGERLVGIVTDHDLLRFLTTYLEETEGGAR